MRFDSLLLALSWSVASVSAYAINSPLPFHRPHNIQRRTPSFIIDLRDRIIESIFKPSSNHKGKDRVTDSSAPQTLLARYGDDVVLRFNISTPSEVKALAEATNTLFLDVWEFTTQWADIRLSKDMIPSLLGLLPNSLQHAHRPLLHDLAQSIYESFPSPPSAETSPQPDHITFSPSTRTTPDETNIFFKDYQPLAVIVHWMELLESLFPTHTRIVKIGTSFEGRDILGLRVGVHPTNSEQPSEPRKTILITGGSHAREWISVSSVNYVLYSLVTAYGKDKEMTRLIEHFDWVFIPTLNPDGYVYSWENDRLWRKNRQQTSFRFCSGLDLDRAFGFQWEGEPTKGNPCSESYAGEIPFEGVESLKFANWVKNETVNNITTFIGYLDLHSYSQEILYPYSYSCDDIPPSLENLEEVALGISKAIHQVNGEHYGVEAACEGNVGLSGAAKRSKEERRKWPKLESGGGSALDWMHHDMNVRYAYQIKLRDTGGYGFLLPNNNILPTGKEIFNAVQYFGRYLLSNHGIERVSGFHPPSDADIKTSTMRESEPSDDLAIQADRPESEELDDADHGLEL